MSVNDDHYFRQLLDKYANNLASPEEVEELFALIKKSGNDKALLGLLVNTLEETAPIVGEERLWDQQFDELMETARGRDRKQMKPKRYGWIAVAASILLFLSIGSYYVFHKQPARQTAYYKNDIAPGGNKAILTLANGTKISLTDAKNGNIAQQAGTQISKTQNGQVVYVANSMKPTAVIYNTMATPKGGQYALRLADGTLAVLDAASSIKYPVTFTGNERKVEITGQVYFEVVHNAARPFRVVVGGQTIEDLGTHFNINAYADEPIIKTTLLEGSVRVAANGQQALLKPGQQARWGNAHLSVVQVDVDEETAWKNGNFEFDDADIKTVMRQLVRWYNVDIKYDTNVPEVHYSGIVPRKSNISAVLNMLKETGHTNFKIVGRTVTVIK